MNFFNRATNAMETVSKNVSKAAKDNIEIVKCSAAVDTCESKIREIYTEIGKRYYKEEGIEREAFQDLFEMVASNEKQIEELKERLQVLKGSEICPSCGAEVQKGTNFCKWCGARVEPVKMQPVSGKTCSVCHAPLTGEEAFCGSCGSKVETAETEEEIKEFEEVLDEYADTIVQIEEK